MLTDLALAELCEAVYSDALPTALGWCGHWEKPGIHVALFSEGAIDYVIFRGSKTITDFSADVAAAQIAYDSEWGAVPVGFAASVRELADILDLSAGRDVVCTGHSLGGAQAALYAAHLCVMQRAPRALITFAEPKTCSAKMIDFLQAIPTKRAWVNEGDPVFDLPPAFIGRLDHSGPIRRMKVVPDPGDALGFCAPHRLAYYKRGLPAP